MEQQSKRMRIENGWAKAVAAGAVVAAALPALAPATAFAAGGTSGLSATAASVISLTVPTAGTFNGSFAPGNTITGTMSLSATDNGGGTWALTASDARGSSSAPGHMNRSGGPQCVGSQDAMVDSLSIGGGSYSGATASTVSLSHRPETILTGTGQLTDALLPVNYSQSVGAGDSVTNGCTYSISVAFTLQ